MTRPWKQAVGPTWPTFTAVAIMVLALALVPAHIVAFVVTASLLAVGNAFVAVVCIEPDPHSPIEVDRR